MVPDADALGYFAGVPYESLFGHRGFTHSICFAALWAALVTWLFFKREERWPWIALTLFIATVSHPLFDMLTNGGLGVALLSPFSNERFFFPWRPIRVSPISISGFFTRHGLAVFSSEVLWVWVPSLLLVVCAKFMRRAQTK